MIREYTLNLYEDGTVDLTGIDLSTSKARLVCENGQSLVIHLPGRTYFGGLGRRSYASAKLSVYKKNGKWGKPNKQGTISIPVEIIIDIEISKGWKKKLMDGKG